MGVMKTWFPSAREGIPLEPSFLIGLPSVVLKLPSALDSKIYVLGATELDPYQFVISKKIFNLSLWISVFFYL